MATQSPIRNYTHAIRECLPWLGKQAVAGSIPKHRREKYIRLLHSIELAVAALEDIAEQQEVPRQEPSADCEEATDNGSRSLAERYVCVLDKDAMRRLEAR